MKRGYFGQVLHEVPNCVFRNLPLRHSVGPPSLLVKHRQLQALGQPDCKVVVQGAPLLKLSHPDIAENLAVTLTPYARCL